MFSWFERRVDAFPEKQPEKPPRGLIAFCRYYTKGVWFWLGVMAFFTAAMAIMEVSLFGFLGTIVNWLSSVPKAQFFSLEKWKLFGLGISILVVLPLIVAGQNLTIHQTLLGNYPMRIRWLVHRYLLGQSVEYFQKESSGRISSKILQTAVAVRETVMKLFNVLNYILVYFTGTLIIAAASDWRFMLPFLGWLGLYVGLLIYFIPRLRSSSQDQADANALMTGRIVDAYANIATVKLFSQNFREEAYAKKGFESFQKTVNNQMRLITKFSTAVYFLNCLLLFCVGALGIYLWQHNILAVSAVAVGVGLALRLNGMAQWIMWEMTALFENIGIVQDGMHSIAQERAIEDKASAQNIKVEKAEISFENVGFSYSKKGDKGGLNNFNLKIKAGEKIGIVGTSGAGKSTLINLLLRFHEAQEGRILIDGQNIAEVKQESLRENIATVMQDTALLHRTLGENIVYGRPTASEEELWQAIEKAEAGDFVRNFCDNAGNKGLNAMVGERGSALSGGQRQRIAIARAMLKNAPILILDEATSALDTSSEFEIQKNLQKLMQGKTVLAIAHRLSTIAQMDRLIVMDKGEIIEEGTHAELLNKNGFYAALWRKQSGLSEDTDLAMAAA